MEYRYGMEGFTSLDPCVQLVPQIFPLCPQPNFESVFHICLISPPPSIGLRSPIQSSFYPNSFLRISSHKFIANLQIMDLSDSILFSFCAAFNTVVHSCLETLILKHSLLIFFLSCCPFHFLHIGLLPD